MKKEIKFSNPVLKEKLFNREVTATLRSAYFVEMRGVKVGETFDVIYRDGKTKPVNLGVVKIVAVEERDLKEVTQSELEEMGYETREDLCKALIRYFRYNTWFSRTEKSKYEEGELHPCEYAEYIVPRLMLIRFKWLNKTRDLTKLIPVKLK